MIKSVRWITRSAKANLHRGSVYAMHGHILNEYLRYSACGLAELVSSRATQTDFLADELINVPSVVPLIFASSTTLQHNNFPQVLYSFIQALESSASNARAAMC